MLNDKKDNNNLNNTANASLNLILEDDYIDIEDIQKHRHKKIFIISVAAALVVLCLLVAAKIFIKPKAPEINIPPVTNGDTLAAQGVEHDKIYSFFSAVFEKNKYETSLQMDNVFEVEDEQSEENTTGGAAYSGTEFTQTGTQSVDIDEGDIVKTDGKCIYVLRESFKEIFVLEPKNGKLSKISEINYAKDSSGETTNDNNFLEMYVKNGRLVVITQSYVKGDFSAYKIVSRIYNIVTPSNPQLIETNVQSGNYVSSRIIDNNLFIFTTQTFYNEPVKDNIKSFVPTVGTIKDEKPVSEENICAFSGLIDRSYFVASSVDISGGNLVSTKAVLGGGKEIYVNGTFVYSAQTNPTYNYCDEKLSNLSTGILKLQIEEGKLIVKETGSVKGTVLNRFSLDEHNGFFRIVTTSFKEKETNNGSSEVAVAYNNLYILDDELKTAGKIEDIAKGERVYSVRLDGDIGYFATGKQVGPIFTVDLSNPKEPKALPALKISGFADYLHPYNEGKLFGIGKNADSETGVTSTVKLSMYDVSNPKNVTEENTLSVPIVYTYSEENHKSVLIDAENNYIGFMGTDYTKYNYYLYKYTEKGFERVGEFGIRRHNKIGNTRGLFLGEYFYICTELGILSYDTTEYEKVDEFLF